MIKTRGNQKSVINQFSIKHLIDNVILVACCACLFTCANQRPNKLNASASTSNHNQISLSQQALDSAQLEILTVQNQPDQARIITTGEIKADENRVFHINSIVAGRVLEDNVTLGKTIKRGEELAVIQNLEVARTYGEYIHQAHQNEVDIAQVQARLELAKKTVQRLSRLSQEGIVAEKDLLLAENQQKILEIDLKGLLEHHLHIKAEAKELLATYGVSLEKEEKKGIEHIDSGSPIVAPKSGVVIQKNVTVGDVVSPSQILYVVADLSQVWLDIAVYDKDLQKIKEGQLVTFRSDSLHGTKFSGNISYIQPVAGDTTKTFLARVILPNQNMSLKPGMFGQAEISGSSNKEYPYLYDRSLQKFDNETFAFIRRTDGSFKKCPVTLGERVGDGYLITEGISAGQEVVGRGSFKLKSELLKSKIGNED
jgi:membrane fusion protein, heavy metal efflux system